MQSQEINIFDADDCVNNENILSQWFIITVCALIIHLGFYTRLADLTVHEK
jgi:hypothetical protein